jgi:hypothetical protein
MSSVKADRKSTYMATSQGLLGTERLLDTVDITKRRKTCLEVQLTGLSQV